MIPVPKANELIDQVVPLLTERRPSQIAIRRIRLEAEKLVRNGIDPADGHMLLGMLDALEFNIPGTKEHFRIAQDLSSSRVIPFNFCVIARRLTLFSDAHRVADSLLSRYPDDAKVLGLVDEVAGLCCDFEMMFETRDRLGKLGKRSHGLEHMKFDCVMARAKGLGITTEDIVERFEAAGSVLVNAKEPNFGAIFDVSPEGTVAYAFGVDADAEELTNYSLEIADILVDRFEDPLSDLITISCLKKRELPTRQLAGVSEEAGS